MFWFVGERDVLDASGCVSCGGMGADPVTSTITAECFRVVGISLCNCCISSPFQ